MPHGNRRLFGKGRGDFRSKCNAVIGGFWVKNHMAYLKITMELQKSGSWT